MEKVGTTARSGEGDAGTIYALASGAPPSAVAVVRISGPSTRFALETIAGGCPPARRASLRRLRDPADGSTLDRALVLFFPGPGSFTGEDGAELHLHGGPAVVRAVLRALGSLPGLAPAEAGAFTLRALENGRLDLTAVEGLADLVAAETEAQRRQALAAADGALHGRVEAWRSRLLDARAAVEAGLDFSEEDDVPELLAERAAEIAAGLRAEVVAVLAEGDRGERIRDGFRVAIAGPPNAGKSSLLNHLARRDVAIVTPVPGTTRDVLEVRLDLGGLPVIVADTAGLRAAEDPVEAEGVRRARERAAVADLVLWLAEDDLPPPEDVAERAVAIATKADLRPWLTSAAGRLDSGTFPRAISVLTGAGLPELEAALAARARSAIGGEPALVTRERQRLLLESFVADLGEVSADAPAELVAEALRRASDRLGRLAGRIDVEEVLGAIFSTFCIGK